jgi:hypothetical protein
LVSCDKEGDENLCKIVEVESCTDIESFYLEKDETPCLELNKIPPCLINATSYLCDIQVVCAKKFVYNVFIDVNTEPVIDDYVDRKNKIIVRNYMNTYYTVFLVYNCFVGILFSKFITWRIFWIVARIIPKTWFDKIVDYWIESCRYAYY